MQKKKLQVFVSSTFIDLKEERQAAVEAILSAGHIPAGMELFAASNKSQWEIIKTWIEESDVYMLILGGRYGSIEPESGKSYTHLEYEYAMEIEKPLFAVVITEPGLDDKVKRDGRSMIEQENNHKLKDFKALVESKIVKHWSNKDQIQLAIFKSLGEYERTENLIGWIPGDQGLNGAEVAEELAKLSKENTALRAKLAEYENEGRLGGLRFDDIYDQLLSEQIESDEFGQYEFELLEGRGVLSGKSPSASLMDYLLVIAEDINGDTDFNPLYSELLINKLSHYGIVQIQRINIRPNYIAKTCSFTDRGREFYLWAKRNKHEFSV